MWCERYRLDARVDTRAWGRVLTKGRRRRGAVRAAPTPYLTCAGRSGAAFVRKILLIVGLAAGVAGCVDVATVTV
jgi:hypothetical protein